MSAQSLKDEKEKEKNENHRGVLLPSVQGKSAKTKK